MLVTLSKAVCKPYISLVFPTKIIGRENVIDGKAVVVCNHYSLADSVIMYTRVFKNDLHPLVKKEAYKSKIAAWYMKNMGLIKIDRSIIDVEANRQVYDLLNSGQKVLIYPEGTRNRSGDPSVMAPLKAGAEMFALKTNSPIIPLTYYRRHKAFRKNYLIIGKPIYFDVDSTMTPRQQRALCMKRIEEAFSVLRREVDEYADSCSR